MVMLCFGGTPAMAAGSQPVISMAAVPVVGGILSLRWLGRVV